MVPPIGASRYGNWSMVLHPFEGRVASKTHQFDESAVVDAPDFMVLLDPALAERHRLRLPLELALVERLRRRGERVTPQGPRRWRRAGGRGHGPWRRSGGRGHGHYTAIGAGPKVSHCR